MYKNFFGLRENPFNVNPDPRYLFLTTQTQEALDEMTYGINARKGLIVLTGEVGTGKTTLINRLLDWLHQQNTPTAFIFNSHLESCHLFDFILSDFGVPLDSQSRGNRLLRLNQWLIERYHSGETAVLIVDEAQGLPVHVLEEIRMLLNLETPHAKLLQIVLAGQPELEEQLKRPDMRQLKQRITLRCRTAALTSKETHDYVHARLRIAGANGKPIFAREALDAVHFYSRGIPRIVNLLCEHGLINAYVDHVRPVPAAIIEEIAREFQFEGDPASNAADQSWSLINAKLMAMESAPDGATAEPAPATAEFLFGREDREMAIPDAFTRLDLANAMDGPNSALHSPIMNCGEVATLNRDEITLAGMATRSSAEIEAQELPKAISVPGEVVTVNIPELILQREQWASSGTLLRFVETGEAFKRLPTSAASQPVWARQKPVRLSIAASSAKSTFFGGRRMAPRTPGLWLAHQVVKFKIRIIGTADCLDWATMSGTLRKRVTKTIRSAKELHRSWSRWLRESHAPTRPRATDSRSLYRWLEEPWTPARKRLSHARRIDTLKASPSSHNAN